MIKAEILKERLIIIADKLRYLGIEPSFYPNNNRFTLDMQKSKLTQFGVMHTIRIVGSSYTDDQSGEWLIDLDISPYAEDCVNVCVKTVKGLRCNYYLGFIEMTVLELYKSSGISINKYYEDSRTDAKRGNPTTDLLPPSHWQGGIPANMERNNFLYHDKISEIDHVKTTFICPSCFGRISFNVKSETTFSITSDIENFDIERTRTTFAPVCTSCNQSMFECDEDFVDRIIKLNLLNIVTEYCCSGHKETFDRVRTNNNTTQLKEVEDYSYPYIIINLAETKPEVVSVILAKAQIKKNNLTVMFMDESPSMRIAPETPKSINFGDKVPEDVQKKQKETLFKFIDEIIHRFDKEEE